VLTLKTLIFYVFNFCFFPSSSHEIYLPHSFWSNDDSHLFGKWSFRNVNEVCTAGGRILLFDFCHFNCHGRENFPSKSNICSYPHCAASEQAEPDHPGISTEKGINSIATEAKLF
jgi:hypothetical protein